MIYKQNKLKIIKKRCTNVKKVKTLRLHTCIPVFNYVGNFISYITH